MIYIFNDKTFVILRASQTSRRNIFANEETYLPDNVDIKMNVRSVAKGKFNSFRAVN